MNVINVVGARPNFMKVTPLHRAFVQSAEVQSMIVHTGQHYDARMSDVFFSQLGLPEPDVYLGIGGGSHAEQTARVMMAFEDVAREQEPDLVLVVGDVNSTLACSLVAAKLNVPVAHVEAGLRSGDRTMPEEINRIVTDSISDLLFVTEESGLENLAAEGVPEEKVFFSGNVMIDSLVRLREKASGSNIRSELGLNERDYVLVTMHRPSNVDGEEGLRGLAQLLRGLAATVRVVFPCHPRTRNNLSDSGLVAELERMPNLMLLDPLGYLEFLNLMEHASVVITDSGGIQEETTYLQVPCLTLRENTERPITVTLGTNELMPMDAGIVVARVEEILAGGAKKGTIPPLWDGRAAERIVDEILKWGEARGSKRAHATVAK